MKFTLSPEALQNSQNSIKGIFSMLAQAPLMREQAQMDAALKTAQERNANASADLNTAKAGNEQLTLDSRNGMDAEIANNPELTPGRKWGLKIYKWAGPGHVNDFANGLGELQSQDYRTKAAENINDLDVMNRWNTLSKPGAGYMPIDNIGNTGQGFNKATGLGTIISQSLANGYDREVNSRVNENNAQAFSANASGNLANARRDNLGNGFDKSQLRIRAKAVNDIADLNIDPENAKAEVERRMELSQRQSGANSAKNAPPQASAPKMNAAQQKSLQDAIAAINRGAPRDKVLQRLKEKGIDTTGL